MNLDCDDSCATVYIKRGGLVVYGDFVLGDFARKLERELAEAWELLTSEEITRNHIIERGIEMQKELAEAREALDRIARPVWWMQEDQKRKTGSINGINGGMALALSEDAEYLKGIAKSALKGEAK